MTRGDSNRAGSSAPRPALAASVESIDWPDSKPRWRPSAWVAVTACGLAVTAAAGAYDLWVLEPPDQLLPFETNARDWLLAAFLVLVGGFCASFVRTPQRLGRYWERYPRDWPSLFGLGVVLAFFAVGLLAPLLVGDPVEGFGRLNQPPAFASIDEGVVTSCIGEVRGGRCYGSLEHPLGTNRNGIDVLAFVVHATRTSLEMAVLVSMIAVPIAVAVGSVAAYAGGRVDDALMRYVDVQQVVPAFFVYFVLYFTYGPSQLMLIVVFGLLSWGGIARIVRMEVRREREELYVLAAKNAGVSRLGRYRRHVLPNVAGPVFVAATLQVPMLLVIEASLAFLDLGDPLLFSWGELIAQNVQNIRIFPWQPLVPGLLLSVTILGFYLFGDALQDVFAPRLD